MYTYIYNTLSWPILPWSSGVQKRFKNKRPAAIYIYRILHLCIWYFSAKATYIFTRNHERWVRNSERVWYYWIRRTVLLTLSSAGSPPSITACEKDVTPCASALHLHIRALVLSGKHVDCVHRRIKARFGLKKGEFKWCQRTGGLSATSTLCSM